jgi:hypothetical protein
VPVRAILVACLLGLCARAADAPAERDIRNAAESVTKSLGVQSRLPTDSGTVEPSLNTRLNRRGFSLGDAFSIATPGAVLNLSAWVLIAALVIAVLAFLAIWFREPADSRGQPLLSPGSVVLEPLLPPQNPQELLAQADRLAAAGQFSNAMHHVLLAAMAVLSRGKSRKAVDSLTSWELLRSAALAPPQVNALRDLVVCVERAWFGKAPAGREDYQQVRGSFEAFASGAAESA